VSGPLLLPSWDQLPAKVPDVTGPMRRYLEQIACVLRPGSVVNTDQTLRCFAAFLAEAAPPVTGLAQISRRHVEAFKPWLAARPGQNKPAVTPSTIAHRLGTLRMFFVRIDEWGWDDAPARVPARQLRPRTATKAAGGDAPKPSEPPRNLTHDVEPTPAHLRADPDATRRRQR
jgi:hypothetical protein